MPKSILMFYEGIQSALRRTTIDDDVVYFIEICYCLESGLYPTGGVFHKDHTH